MNPSPFAATQPFGARPPARPPAAWRPGAARVVARPVLGQEAAARGLALGFIAVPTALAVASSYVGFRLGYIDRGFPSVLGYIVGVTGGIGAFFGLLSMLGVALIPLGVQPEIPTERPQTPTFPERMPPFPTEGF
jgi:hypothetical protein